MSIRYALLPYMYTLFQAANAQGEMVTRPLQFEFPNEAYLAGVDNQFLLGPSILVTPVLQPLVDYVQGMFPGTRTGTIWYDWYTLQQLQVQHMENITLSAPLEHINVHVRGGSILPLQQPGYTTSESRLNPWSLLVALDPNGLASGRLYLDDGYSIAPNATKEVDFLYGDSKLLASVAGNFTDTNPLANITLAGMRTAPSGIQINGPNALDQGAQMAFDKGVLRVTGLLNLTSKGAWYGERFVLKFQM